MTSLLALSWPGRCAGRGQGGAGVKSGKDNTLRSALRRRAGSVPRARGGASPELLSCVRCDSCFAEAALGALWRTDGGGGSGKGAHWGAVEAATARTRREGGGSELRKGSISSNTSDSRWSGDDKESKCKIIRQQISSEEI